MSMTVQIQPLIWLLMPEPSTALAILVCSALSEPTYVTLVLAGSRTLSPVDQELPRLTYRPRQLDLEWIGIPLDKARESRPVLLDCHPTPNLIPPRLAARLRLIHGAQRTPIVRRQADPERKAGNGLSAGNSAAANAPCPNGGSYPWRSSDSLSRPSGRRSDKEDGTPQMSRMHDVRQRISPGQEDKPSNDIL
jgi:hypothetical protein